MNKVLGLLFAALFVVTGCSLIPETPYVAEYDMTFEDGTSVKKGEAVYENKDGKATAKPTADDGTPHKRLQVKDEKKVEELQGGGEKAASALPFPFNVIAGIGIPLLFGGGIAGIRAYNARKKKNAGIPPPSTTTT